MGCDIHSYTEVRSNNKWESVDFHPFDWRSYGMYGFLADVRNYSHVPVIKKPSSTLPTDVSEDIKDMWNDERGECHSVNWVTLRELTEDNYDQSFWDRRVMKRTGPNSWNGAALAEPGEGEVVTIREFLCTDFFKDIEELKTLGSLDDVRVVFWFDN